MYRLHLSKKSIKIYHRMLLEELGYTSREHILVHILAVKKAGHVNYCHETPYRATRTLEHIKDNGGRGHIEEVKNAQE